MEKSAQEKLACGNRAGRERGREFQSVARCRRDGKITPWLIHRFHRNMKVSWSFTGLETRSLRHDILPR